MTQIIIVRYCNTCNIPKFETDFYRQKSGFLYKRCKECERQRKYLWIQNNQEKMQLCRDNWEKNHPTRRREWEMKNRAKSNESKRKWKELNPEKNKAINKRWEQNNLDKIRLKNHQRRAKIFEVGGTYTTYDIQTMFSNQNGICANVYCKKILDEYHIDHIFPLSLGGSNGVENLQLLCPSCNCSKSNMLPFQWIQKYKEQHAIT